ncbi:MFS transporter [Priestia megaterium]|uniref:MFS transporter n=1 Tax=Priestia megaterium TaxID=1404 RepID=UPI0021C15DDB|nr:MFS transporter [Priestia megaterium]MCT9855772.1 MFS transporter [Priestia megaterium]MDF1962979.1 MFS transporter [Priestia megaterium]
MELAKTDIEINSSSVGKAKISPMEKVCFGLGDTASNFVWGICASYLLFFYTDVYGISAVAVGTLFLITRILDAVANLVMGVIVDRTKSKHGKARPYLLYLSIPLGIMFVLTFITPDFSYTGKLIYAYITYFFLGVLFTAVNLPYGSMLTMMTQDTHERQQLGSYRTMGMGLGATIVSLCTLPLVSFFGKGNQQIGFPIVISLYSIVATIMFFLVFKNCKERYTDSQDIENKGETWKQIVNMFKNKPWLLLAISTLMMNIGIGAVSSIIIYYGKYVLNVPVMATILLVVVNGGNFIGGLIASPILKRFGNRNGNLLCLSGSLLSFILLIYLGKQIILFTILVLITYVFMGVSFAALYAMLSDTIDYQGKKFGKKSESLLYASNSFATVFGLAIGSALVGYALGWAGYNSNAITDEARNAISIILFASGILFTVLQIIPLLFYKLKDISILNKQNIQN